MREESARISCNGKEIASRILIPESLREKAKGMYGRKAEAGTAMLYKFSNEGMQMFDMMWMKEPLGFIALDRDRKVIEAGVMRPWVSGWLGKCQYFIEVVPAAVQGIKKGEVVSFHDV